MEFTHRKLPKEAADKMRSCPVSSVQPYALMLAPTYVFLRSNGKFLAVKGPLDFFTPRELEKVGPFESFFFTDFIDQILPFRDRAKSVRALLKWKPLETRPHSLPPASFEISDSMLKLVAPLWTGEARIEPFFVAAFINELCDLLPGESLERARETDIARFDRAILTSAWATFLALHLGCCELGFLSRFRRDFFEELMDDAVSRLDYSPDLLEVRQLAHDTCWAVQAKEFSQETLSVRNERVAQKILGRLVRIETLRANSSEEASSVYGEKGFLSG